MNLLWYIQGSFRLEVSPEKISLASSLLYKNSIHTHIYKKRSLNIGFICKCADLDKIKKLFLENNIEVLSEKHCGLPSVLVRYKRRPGVYFGVFLLFFSMLVSRMFIWRINITGNDTVSRASIVELLEQHGVYVGAFSPKLDLRSVYNQILIDNKELCWISVNLRGTVANVEVRETEQPLKLTPDEHKYANIIAEYDGQITLVEVRAGQSYVKYGDYVRAGELLVSGLYENKLGQTVCEYAYGEIYAVIEKDFYIEIPLEYEEKVYLEEQKSDFSLKIFSKTINIINNSGKIDTMYDIIEENEEICIFDSVTLPISYLKKTYKEYSIEKLSRSEAQASRIAYERLNREIADFTGNGEVLSKDIEQELTDGVFKLKIKAKVNKNIAKIQEFIYTEG